MGEIRIHSSMRLMLETVVKRWKENLNDGWDENFRKGDLWTYDVEWLLSVNENPLREIY